MRFILPASFLLALFSATKSGLYLKNLQPHSLQKKK